MPYEIAKELAGRLQVLTLSEMPVAFLGMDGSRHKDYPPFSREAQQLSVDLIYRCLKSELLAISPEEWSLGDGIHSIEAFVGELARVDKNQKTSIGAPGASQHALDMGVWLEPELYCTEVGDALVRRHFPEERCLDDKASVVCFNEEICALFAENGVPWGSGPLVQLNF